MPWSSGTDDRTSRPPIWTAGSRPRSNRTSVSNMSKRTAEYRAIAEPPARAQPSSARAARTADIIAAELGPALLHGAGLEPAVGVDPDAVGRQDGGAPADPGADVVGGLHGVRVDVEHAEREVLGERVLLEHRQEIEGAVRDREVEVVHRQVEEARVDRLEGAEARVDDVVGGEPVDDEVHRLDGEAQLVGPDRERGLVDLDDADPGLEQRLDFLPDLAGEREAGGLAVRIVVVERPVHEGVRAR